MRNRAWLVLALLLWGCPTDEVLDDDSAAPEGFDAHLAAQLQEALEVSRLAADAPGASQAVVVPGEGRGYGVDGDADMEADVAVRADDLFRIGAITKTYTAAVVLQLHDEGLLHVDDPLEQWVPGVFEGEGITLRHLLGHTSGIFNYTDDPAFTLALDEYHPPEELVEFAVEHGLQFAPGTAYSYSNTNYILLGMVTAEATGDGWASQVRLRLLEPLGLEATFIEGEEEIPGGTVRGHLGGLEATDTIDMSLAWAAGCVVADSDDMLTWIDALLVGEALSDDARELLLTPGQLDDGTSTPYGLGVRIYPSEPGTWIGHTGSTMGFQSDLFALDGVAVATLLNDFLSEASDVSGAAWNVLLDEDVGFDPHGTEH